jgi:O-antigen/teichoic acid export membrane protein
MATPASNVMMVQMGDNLRQGRPERLIGIWRETTRKLAFVFFPLVGLLIVNAYHLITLLYTTRYAASVPIFMVWSLSILFSAFQTDGVLRTFAENKYLLVINLIRLAFIVALMNWFFAGFHLQGPVLITIIGILMAKAMAMVRIKKLLNTTYAQVLPWKTLGFVTFTSMVSAVPAIVINAKLNMPSLVVLPIAGMAYVITYAILMLALGVLDENEKASLKRIVMSWTRAPMQAARQAGVGGRAA